MLERFGYDPGRYPDRYNKKIDELDVPYMLTGGIAVMFYGKPWMTHDTRNRNILFFARRHYFKKTIVV
jgi:hypothetical protein